MSTEFRGTLSESSDTLAGTGAGTDGCAGSTGDAGRSLSSGGAAKGEAAQFDDVGPHQQSFLIFIGDMLDGDDGADRPRIEVTRLPGQFVEFKPGKTAGLAE